MKKTIKEKTYELKEGIWVGTDKNGKEFKVTVKSLLETLNKEDEVTTPKLEESVLEELKSTSNEVLETLVAPIGEKEDNNELVGILNIGESFEVRPLLEGTWLDEAGYINEKQKEILENFQSVDISGVKETKESTGLGDTVAKITQFFGIEPCEKCEERKQKLNSWFPYLKKDVRELTEEEIEMMRGIQGKMIIDGRTITKIFALYNSLFGTKLERCSCPGLLKKVIERISILLDDEQE